MRRLSSLILMTLLATLACAVNATAYYPSYPGYGATGTVAGTVTDGTTGEPLGDVCAVVRGLFGGIPGGSARTNSEGRYAVSGLSTAGAYDISFSDCATPSRGYGTFKHPQGLSFPPYSSTPITLVRDAKLYRAAGGQPDGDADGIADGVDTAPAAVSRAFADTSGTSGEIEHAAGLPVTVTDLDAPGGVRVAVGADPTPDPLGSPAYVALRACGFALGLQAGTTADVTCGSIRVAVVSGAPAKVDLGDTVVTIPVGATARVTEDPQDGTAGVESISGPPVSVDVGGVSLTVAPGESTTVVAELDADSLCGLLRRSATATAAQGDGPVPAACRLLALAGSERPGSHVTAFARQLDALVGQGRLGAAEADRLQAFAAAL